jgi:glycosyltransferase involved in cell wall biosynthesis
MPWNGDIIWKKNRSFLHECVVKRSLRLANLIPLQTEYLKNRCIELGADKKKIELVQFGVDFNKFRFDVHEENVRRELGLDTDNIVISTRNIAYNIITIVKSIPLVIKSIPDAKFIFVWPNTEKESIGIIARIKKLGVENSVRIIGRLSNHDDMAKYLSLAKTFVSVSEIDCFPQTGFEAMAMKVFPVMSDIAPIRSCIKDRVNGILVNPIYVNSVAKGIIDSLTMSKDAREDIVECNYQFVRDRADFNKEMQKMEVLYFRVIERTKK